MDIDFTSIAPRLGGTREAFEELCSQLARRTTPSEVPFWRLRGAGGDGGVECFADYPEGKTGWQAKYVFDVDALITQATASLETALRIHPTLTRYVVCFPADHTGPTGRGGLSGLERLAAWKQKHESQAAAAGRQLTIELWPAHILRDLLLTHDLSGGLREYFFNLEVLDEAWFSEHLALAQEKAGPRYSPDLNVQTDLAKWFDAFGRSPEWLLELGSRIQHCRAVLERHSTSLDGAVRADRADGSADLNGDARLAATEARTLLDELSALESAEDFQTLEHACARLDGIIQTNQVLAVAFLEKLKIEHPSHDPDTPGFRQWMAEYMVSFPTAELDSTRRVVEALTQLIEWLRSPANSLAYQRVFVLSGNAGTGKTHGVCDVGARRLTGGQRTSILFGHEFGGEPDPWTRSAEALGLPATLGMNGLLDALNAAGESTGKPLILMLDAINETRPLPYWQERLGAFAGAIEQRPFLRLCITCRSSFLAYCLPHGHILEVVEHRGFVGVELEACRAFFTHYGLEPPVAPLLLPELANPLYLKLLCETLSSRGERKMPVGWHGLAPVIQAFLDEKERAYAKSFGTSVSTATVSGSLIAVIQTIVAKGRSAISWSEARTAIATSRPAADPLMLEWLVRSDLLVDDAPAPGSAVGTEGTVRPSFERFGDFLVAQEVLRQSEANGMKAACEPNGLIHALFADQRVLEQNSGILAALTVLMPESKDRVEFPTLVSDEVVRDQILRLTIASLAVRNPDTITTETVSLIEECLQRPPLVFETLDAMLTLSWRPSLADATLLDSILRWTPLARRDALWCKYLYESYEAKGAVFQLIDKAFPLPLASVDVEVKKLWSSILIWFTAAADRRIKDRATRGAIAILATEPVLLHDLLFSFMDVDDDEIRERALLVAYGVLMLVPAPRQVEEIVHDLHRMYTANPTAFDHAQIRDLIRGMCELAQELGILKDSAATTWPTDPLSTAWPLAEPSEAEVEGWKDLPKLALSCLDDDFCVYSMGCLRPWEHAMPRQRSGKWILARIARDFGYADSGCPRYDARLLRERGGGRSTPAWAERIGKKYQWVALNQLASKLHDHIERKEDSWHPELLRTPLILLEERKLDPTLPYDMLESERDSKAWWLNQEVDFGLWSELGDEQWVKLESDIPALEELLGRNPNDGQEWLTLACYPEWTNRVGEDFNTPYADVWMHVESYLVAESDCEQVFARLHERNFFGRWMQEGSTWSYGFAGEYPWGTAFNTEPDSWHGRGGNPEGFPHCECTHNMLAAEWEYDGSLSTYRHIHLPARSFFAQKDLRWNGRDGFQTPEGRAVFRDPSITEFGPSGLIADANALTQRLAGLGLRLVWTLLGEKMILGGDHRGGPRCTFSQIAMLERDGSIRFGRRVFFEDENKDANPSRGEQT